MDSIALKRHAIEAAKTAFEKNSPKPSPPSDLSYEEQEEWERIFRSEYERLKKSSVVDIEQLEKQIQTPIRLPNEKWYAASVLAAYHDKMILDRRKREPIQPPPLQEVPENEVTEVGQKTAIAEKPETSQQRKSRSPKGR